MVKKVIEIAGCRGRFASNYGLFVKTRGMGNVSHGKGGGETENKGGGITGRDTVCRLWRSTWTLVLTHEKGKDSLRLGREGEKKEDGDRGEGIKITLHSRAKSLNGGEKGARGHKEKRPWKEKGAGRDGVSVPQCICLTKEVKTSAKKRRKRREESNHRKSKKKKRTKAERCSTTKMGTPYNKFKLGGLIKGGGGKGESAKKGGQRNEVQSNFSKGQKTTSGI